MFAKIFEQIFDSSIACNPTVRHVFMDFLLLADAHGVVDMTYEAISRRTNVPVEVVISAIGELMKADPESRSSKSEGARLVPLDSHRTWGWKIVNYDHYRKLRDEESRRSYFRDAMRESRRKKKEQAGEPVKDVKDVKENGGNGAQNGASVRDAGETKGPLKPVKESDPSPWVSVKELLNGVNQGERKLNRLTQEEEEAEEVPSTVSLAGRQSNPLVTDPLEFKRLVCPLLLEGKNPARMWSPEAENRLATMCKDEGGIPLKEIQDLIWFRSLENNPDEPDLAGRRTLSETSLMTHWADYTTRAMAYRKKHALKNGTPAKPEPPRWREFMQWRHENPDIVLPRSFWQMSREHRADYEANFQTFGNCVPEGPTP